MHFLSPLTLLHFRAISLTRVEYMSVSEAYQTGWSKTWCRQKCLYNTDGIISAKVVQGSTGLLPIRNRWTSLARWNFRRTSTRSLSWISRARSHVFATHRISSSYHGGKQCVCSCGAARNNQIWVSKNIKPAEILRRLQAWHGEQTLSLTRLYQWCQQFRKGRPPWQKAAWTRSSDCSHGTQFFLRQGNQGAAKR